MKSLDDLIRHLIQEVALCGDEGATPDDFAGYVRSYYNQDAASNNALSHAKPALVDQRLLQKIWTWLTRHPEIDVGKNDQPNALLWSEARFPDRTTGSTEQLQLHSKDSTAKERGDTTKDIFKTVNAEHSPDSPASPGNRPELRNFFRIHASVERRWQAIAGHDPDPVKVPSLDFACLSIIAARRERGILQPELVRISGQDKRSVPERTKRLQAGGYISKTPVIANGSNTSKLILKKYVKAVLAHATEMIDDNDGDSAAGTNSVAHHVDFQESQRKLFGILRDAKLITRVDLKERLGILGPQWPRKLLTRNLRRLESLGCVKQVKARPEGDIATPFYFRCVKFLREPVGKEWYPLSHLSRSRAKSKTLEEYDALDEDSDDEHDDEAEEARFLSAVEDSHQQLRNLKEIDRPVPQWSGDSILNNLLFSLIDQAGLHGISTMELKDRSLGKWVARPIENQLTKLVDLWQISQPIHLRHLAVVRDAALTNNIPHYVHYTFENFQELVRQGKASWEAVTSITRDNKKLRNVAAVDVEPDLDEHGFHRVPIDLFHGRQNDASLSDCIQAANILPISLSTVDPRVARSKHATSVTEKAGQPPLKMPRRHFPDDGTIHSSRKRTVNGAPDLVVRARGRARLPPELNKNATWSQVAARKYKKSKLVTEINRRVDSGEAIYNATQAVVLLAATQYRDAGHEPPWDIIEEVKSDAALKRTPPPNMAVPNTFGILEGFDYKPSIYMHHQPFLSFEGFVTDNISCEPESPRPSEHGGLGLNIHTLLSPIPQRTAVIALDQLTTASPSPKARQEEYKSSQPYSRGKGSLKSKKQLFLNGVPVVSEQMDQRYLPSVIAHTVPLPYHHPFWRTAPASKRKQGPLQHLPNKKPKTITDSQTDPRRSSRVRTNDGTKSYQEQSERLIRLDAGIFIGEETRLFRPGRAGRPRKSKLAVIKSSRLKCLAFFAEYDKRPSTNFHSPNHSVSPTRTGKPYDASDSPAVVNRSSSPATIPVPEPMQSQSVVELLSSQRQSTRKRQQTAKLREMASIGTESAEGGMFGKGKGARRSYTSSRVGSAGRDHSPWAVNMPGRRQDSSPITFQTSHGQNGVAPSEELPPVENIHLSLQQQQQVMGTQASPLESDKIDLERGQLQKVLEKELNDVELLQAETESSNRPEVRPVNETRIEKPSRAQCTLDGSTNTYASVVLERMSISAFSAEAYIRPEEQLKTRRPLVEAQSDPKQVLERLDGEHDIPYTPAEQNTSTIPGSPPTTEEALHEQLENSDLPLVESTSVAEIPNLDEGIDQPASSTPASRSLDFGSEIEQVMTTNGPAEPLNKQAIETLQPSLPRLTIDDSFHSKIDKNLQKMTPQGGSIAVKRRKIVMDIVNRCGGVYPGTRELGIPFRAEWQRLGESGNVEPSTIGTAVKALCESGQLRQLKFALQTSQGLTVPKTIITRVDLSTTDPRVQETERKIIACYPQSYIPEEAGVTEEMRDAFWKRTVPIKFGRVADLEVDEGPVQLKNRPLYLKRFEKTKKDEIEGRVKEKKRRTLKQSTATEPSKRQRSAYLERRLLAQRKVDRLASIKAAIPRDVRQTSKIPSTQLTQLSSTNYEEENLQVSSRAGWRKDQWREDIIRRLNELNPSARTFDFSNVTTQNNFEEDDRSYLSGEERRESSGNDSGVGSNNFLPQQVRSRRRKVKDSRTDLQSHSRDARQQMYTIMDPEHQFHPPTGTFFVNFSRSRTVNQILQKYHWQPFKPKSFLQEVDDAQKYELCTKGLENAAFQGWPFVNYSLRHESMPITQQIQLPRHARWFLKTTGGSSHRTGRKEPAFTEYSGLEEEHPDPTSSHETAGILGKRKSGPTEGLFDRGSTNTRSKRLKHHRYLPERNFQRDRIEEDWPKKKILRWRGPPIGAEESRRLLTTVIVIRILAGGIDKTIDWALVTQALHPRYTEAQVQKYYRKELSRNSAQARKIMADFQTVFVKAYEDGLVPPLDFRDLKSYDWSRLVDWTIGNLDTPWESALDLPSQRSQLHDLFTLREGDQLSFGVYYELDISSTVARREAELHRRSWALPLKIPQQNIPAKAPSELEIAKTWIRANVATKAQTYDPEAARRKLGSAFRDSTLEEALKEMMADRVLQQENKGRPAPGRNYDLKEDYLKPLRKKIEATCLERAPMLKRKMDKVLLESGENMLFPEHADDALVIAVTNMQAHKRIHLVAKNPPMKPFGMMEDRAYRTRLLDKRTFHFDTEIRPNEDTYIKGNPLWPLPRPPSSDSRSPTSASSGAVARIPLWYDINDELIPELWRLALAATVSVLATRPGITVRELETCVRPTLGVWEVEMILGWMMEAEVAKKVGEEGYVTEEWWWLCLDAEEGMEAVGVMEEGQEVGAGG